MRCTVYAQISRFKLKAKVSLMSPQWGKCSKGEIFEFKGKRLKFQSPQWGKCSKAECISSEFLVCTFQSPQWGKCSKDILEIFYTEGLESFSPRNGESVLKAIDNIIKYTPVDVSVPAMGKVF